MKLSLLNGQPEDFNSGMVITGNDGPSLRWRWYVGLTHDHTYKAFQWFNTPTERGFGHLYGAIIGPFKTKRAAKWVERHGLHNPHFQTVADAERLAWLDSPLAKAQHTLAMDYKRHLSHA
jgi:hypothetical protein